MTKTSILAMLFAVAALGCGGSNSGADNAQPWLGQPCDPSMATAPPRSSVLVAAADPSCGGEAACVFALEVGNELCSRTEDCPDSPEGALVCRNSRCVPDDATVEARSMCAPSCEKDAECSTMADSSCETGFVCAIVATNGPECCTKHCVCRDDFTPDDDVEAACAVGVQRGCCDQDPLPAACERQ